MRFLANFRTYDIVSEIPFRGNSGAKPRTYLLSRHVLSFGVNSLGEGCNRSLFFDCRTFGVIYFGTSFPLNLLEWQQHLVLNQEIVLLKYLRGDEHLEWYECLSLMGQ